MATRITIVSPANAQANNGNWQTASRWERFLRSRYKVDIVPQWAAGPAAPAMLIALHARRSAASVSAFAATHPGRPILLVMTGTDLYRDVASGEASALASVDTAHHLVVLQPGALLALPISALAKVSVIFQSAPALSAPLRPANKYTVCMVGHLRAEKDPATFMRAARMVSAPGLSLVHIGATLDPKLGQLAKHTEAGTSLYRWLGSLSHAATRQHISQCHAMVIASTMEGGANVIIEAVTSEVPVLASDIPGNRGMLGDDYAGYFPVGDADALARLIDRSVTDTAFYQQLQAQCAARAALFTPAAEQAALLNLVDNLFHSTTSKR